MRSPLVVLVALVLVVLGAGPALAQAPVGLSDRITDRAGVLGDDSAIREAQNALSASGDVELYAVFVSSFDAESDAAWIQQTAELSGLDDSDLLLAVAVGGAGFEYGWWVADDFPLRDDDVQVVIDTAVVPQLEAGNWGAAVIGLSGGLQPLVDSEAADVAAAEESDDQSWSAIATLLIVAGLAVALLVGHLMSRRRSAAEL